MLKFPTTRKFPTSRFSSHISLLAANWISDVWVFAKKLSLDDEQFARNLCMMREHFKLWTAAVTAAGRTLAWKKRPLLKYWPGQHDQALMSLA